MKNIKALSNEVIQNPYLQNMMNAYEISVVRSLPNINSSTPLKYYYNIWAAYDDQNSYLVSTIPPDAMNVCIGYIQVFAAEIDENTALHSKNIEQILIEFFREYTQVISDPIRVDHEFTNIGLTSNWNMFCGCFRELELINWKYNRFFSPEGLINKVKQMLIKIELDSIDQDYTSPYIEVKKYLLQLFEQLNQLNHHYPIGSLQHKKLEWQIEGIYQVLPLIGYFQYQKIINKN